MKTSKIFEFFIQHKTALVSFGLFLLGLLLGIVFFSDKDETVTLVKYNGGEITNVDFANYILSSDSANKYANDLIEAKIIDLESDRLNIFLSQKEKDAVLNSLVTSYGGESSFNEYLEYNNLNKEVILYHNLNEKILEKIVLANSKYSDKQLESFFIEYNDLFSKPTSYTFNEIVVSDKKLADEIYTKISKGEIFSDLAKEFSEVSSSSVGGFNSDIPETTINASSLSQLSKMSINTMSSVFEGEFGYTILNLLSKNEFTNVEFNDVKDEVENEYKKTLISENYTKWFEDAKKRYSFTIVERK